MEMHVVHTEVAEFRKNMKIDGTGTGTGTAVIALHLLYFVEPIKSIQKVGHMY